MNGQAQSIYKSAADQSSGALSQLETLAGRTSQTLMEIESVFPFDLVPNQIKVDRLKVDIVYRHALSTAYIFTMFIKDITTAKVNRGLFFSSLYFEVKGYEQNPDPLTYLHKDEAERIRDLIIGLRTAYDEEIDVEKISSDRLVDELVKIGSVRS